MGLSGPIIGSDCTLAGTGSREKGSIPGEARVFLRVPGQNNQADGDLLFDRTFRHRMDPLSTRHVHLQRH